jgi:hypothetical protein
MAEGYVAPGFERVREAFDAALGDELGADLRRYVTAKSS